MAEGILQHKKETMNLNITIDSAGTSNYHVGEAPDKRMQQKGKEYGIDISNQRGRQFTVDDFDNFDYIFAMDASNKENILRLSRDEKDNQKVEMFLNYAYPDEDRNVPDPYYGGEQGFEDVYQMLDIACDKFIASLNND
jgi:protein-tyrosine phosphatase